MPDIWTEHPDIVRDLLEAGEFTCGVEPRVLAGRDPEWTCIVDGEDISGDVYIHHMSTAPLQNEQAFWPFVIIGALIVLVALQTWLLLRRRRRADALSSA